MWYLYVRVLTHDCSGKTVGHYWQNTGIVASIQKPEDTADERWLRPWEDASTIKD